MKNVLIQTVTHYFTGEIVRQTKSEIHLKNASWIQDTGYLSECLAKGTVSSCEPIPAEHAVRVSRGAIVAIYEWRHDLPRMQK